MVSESWSTDVVPSDTEGLSMDMRHDAEGAGQSSNVGLAPPSLAAVAEVGEPRNGIRANSGFFKV